jgi:ammonia channel protein AmtB
VLLAARCAVQTCLPCSRPNPRRHYAVGGQAEVAITIPYAFGVIWLILKFVNMFVPVRVSLEEELQGLDEVEHGEVAYAI